MTSTALPNPFMNAPLVPLEVQIEGVQRKLARMIEWADTCREWSAVADVEARELVPLVGLLGLRAVANALQG